MRKGVIERVVGGDHLDPQAFEQFRREGRGGAVAGGADDAEFAGHAEITHEIIKIGLAHAGDKVVCAAGARLAATLKHDIAQFGHFIRAMG